MKILNVTNVAKAGINISVSLLGRMPIIQAYQDRVEADGGTFEMGCILKKVQNMLVLSVYGTYFLPYKTRVESDGGTVEGDSCVINTIGELL